MIKAKTFLNIGHLLTNLNSQMRIKEFPNFYQTKVTPTSYHNLHLTSEKVSLKTSQKGFLEVHHLAKLPMFTLTEESAINAKDASLNLSNHRRRL